MYAEWFNSLPGAIKCTTSVISQSSFQGFHLHKSFLSYGDWRSWKFCNCRLNKCRAMFTWWLSACVGNNQCPRHSDVLGLITVGTSPLYTPSSNWHFPVRLKLAGNERVANLGSNTIQNYFAEFYWAFLVQRNWQNSRTSEKSTYLALQANYLKHV